MFTDSEASKISSVPERSLRLLQSCGIIKATLVPPKDVGGMVRAWPKVDVEIARIVESFHACTGAGYADVARRLLPALDEIRTALIGKSKQNLFVVYDRCGVSVVPLSKVAGRINSGDVQGSVVVPIVTLAV